MYQNVIVAVADVQLVYFRLFGIFIQQTYKYFRRYSDASWLRYLVCLLHLWRSIRPTFTMFVPIVHKVIATM